VKLRNYLKLEEFFYIAQQWWQIGRTLASSFHGLGFKSSRHCWHRERENGKKICF